MAASGGAGPSSTATTMSGSTGPGQGGQGGQGGAHVPTWTVIDSLQVDCEGGDTMSSIALNNGETYTLRASGECTCTDANDGCDAEWLNFNSPQTDAYSGDVDMGIGIDDPVIDLTTPPDWGPYQSSHVYEAPWVGAGSAIVANFHDPLLSNNNGTLTVEILQLQ